MTRHWPRTSQAVRAVGDDQFGDGPATPTHMLVPAARMDEAIEAAQSVADKLTVGAPDSGARLGPVVSQAQFDKIQTLIQSGIDAGATVAFGGTGRPDGLSEGYYVRPTVFANVDNNMEVARTGSSVRSW